MRSSFSIPTSFISAFLRRSRYRRRVIDSPRGTPRLSFPNTLENTWGRWRSGDPAQPPGGREGESHLLVALGVQRIGFVLAQEFLDRLVRPGPELREHGMTVDVA